MGAIFTIFTRKQQICCVYIMFFMIIGAVLEAIGIGAILPLIAIMGNPMFLDQHKTIQEYAFVLNITSHTDFIIIIAVLLMFFYMFKNLYMSWQVRLQIKFSTKEQIYYAKELMAGYLGKPYLYHLNHNSSVLLRNVQSGPITVFENILISTFSLITEVITAIAIWLMLIFVDWFTAIIIAGMLGILTYGIIKMFRKKITFQGEIRNKYSAVYLKWLSQGLGAIKETKVLRKEKFFLDEFNKSYNRYCEVNGEFLFLNQLPRMFIEFIIVSGLLLLIVVRILLGEAPTEIVPLLGVLALAAFRLMPCANRIVNLSNHIKFQMPLFEELYEELLDIKKRKIEDISVFTNDDIRKLPFETKISIEEIDFKYPEGQKNVLKEINLSIPKGCFLGVVGPSGAGKTTFVDILLGLLEPTNGEIYVDGQSIYKNIRAWQANLSYVPQNIYLIDGTISENIALGVCADKIDEQNVEKALKMAELYEFIQALPDKLNTKVGERGVKLSGGQRQRIGIARALYQNPKVLILDEATSALDSKTEKSITNTILNLKGEITIIAIAHRISTLENCDFKIKFEAGTTTIMK